MLGVSDGCHAISLILILIMQQCELLTDEETLTSMTVTADTFRAVEHAKRSPFRLTCI